jgi:hypothetical protein
MGTSKDFSGSTGGGWSGAKRAATRLATSGADRDSIARFTGRYVEALGGASAAAAAAAGGVRAGAAIGRVLSGMSEARGITPTLEEIGLGAMVGRTPIEVVSALADALAGDGSTLEEAAAREALVFVFEDLFEGAVTYEDLEAAHLDADGVRAAYAKYMARYAYNLMLALLDERLVQRGDPGSAAATERHVWEYILARAQIEIADVDIAGIDWRDTARAEAAARGLVRGVLEVLGP